MGKLAGGYQEERFSSPLIGSLDNLDIVVYQKLMTDEVYTVRGFRAEYLAFMERNFSELQKQYNFYQDCV